MLGEGNAKRPPAGPSCSQSALTGLPGSFGTKVTAPPETLSPFKCSARSLIHRWCEKREGALLPDSNTHTLVLTVLPPCLDLVAAGTLASAFCLHGMKAAMGGRGWGVWLK